LRLWRGGETAAVAARIEETTTTAAPARHPAEALTNAPISVGA